MPVHIPRLKKHYILTQGRLPIVTLQWGFKKKFGGWSQTNEKLCKFWIKCQAFNDWAKALVQTFWQLNIQNGHHLLILQLARLFVFKTFDKLIIWLSDNFSPFKFQASLVFRFPLYFVKIKKKKKRIWYLDKTDIALVFLNSHLLARQKMPE